MDAAMNDCDEAAFPAYAGMNRMIRDEGTVETGVPRIRGDEPIALDDTELNAKRSPHTRG